MIARAKGGMSLEGLRLLVVEDEAMVAMLIEGMLEASGCSSVIWTANVPAALVALEENAFDGALLDVNLNGIQVFPVADILKARRVPFLFLTGYGESRAMKTRYPEARILAKPFEISRLEEIVLDTVAPSNRRSL